MASSRHPFYYEIRKQGFAVKLSIPNVLLLVLLVTVTPNLSAEVVTETIVGSGYQGNLFNDSNSTDDTYASVGVGLKYYPSASAQISAGATYNAFSKYDDLSNLTGDLSVVFVPTRESSLFSVTLAGSAIVRKFGTLYELYDQVGAKVGSDFGYQVAPWAYVHSSISYLNTSYTNSDFGSNRGIDVATGINITVLGTNSLALSMEYSRRSFDQPLVIDEGGGDTRASSQNESQTFNIAGILMRYSRPLGERTGMNLSVGHRQLHVDSDYAVLGYTIDYLSPWSDLWEGPSLSGGLKHFFPNQIATELTVAYFEKSFVDVLETAEMKGDPYWRDTRDDRLTTLSASIWRPITLKNEKQLIPSINIGYRKNQSSAGFFEYEGIQASFSLKAIL